MIIKLSEYDGKYRVVSLAKNESIKNLLIKKGLPTIYIEENCITIYPDNISFTLREHEKELFNDSYNFDVFEISSQGNAYKYYNNKSVDNAILITNRCNSNCIMCPTAEIIRKGNEEYKADELIEIAKHFPSDAPHITITGGEPFLIKKDMFKLLNYLKLNLPDTAYLLLTNGRAFCSKEYADLFKQTAPPDIQLGIPIHGYNSQTHDYITQAKGSFKQTYIGLKHLLSIGVKVELRIVISKLNANFITEIASLISKEFNTAFCVKFIGLEMTGNAAKNKENVWIDYSTAFKNAKDGIDILIKSGIDVGIYNFPLCSVDKKYWNICEKSISDYKVRFASACNECTVKDACGGMFSCTIRMAKETVNPIR